MTLDNRISSVRQFLLSHSMLADEEWLSGCVEYLTEDSSSSYTQAEINNLAREQWLLNDLKDICPGSLPNNLKNQIKTFLNGRFVLQINAAIDIGTPAYQQYLKLQKINLANIEATTSFDDKVPSHRMIKLYLTDGVQEITAIEYKPMRNLSCDITPGCKALVKGPIECRRGMLLLTESSIEILGGEVQEIVISNSLPNLLSNKLELPVTEPDPNATLNHPRNTNIPAPHTDMPSNSQALEPIPPNEIPNRPIARVTSVQIANSFADDDIDIDQLDDIEAQLTDNHGKRPHDDTNSRPEKKLKVDTVNRPEDYPEENDISFEDEDHLREMEAKFYAKVSWPAKVSSEPYIYLKQINDMSLSEKCGRVFRIKGQIMKLLSKLSVGKDGWSLRCTLVDGSGSIDVDFTSDVLSKLVGFTPQEMNQLKKEMVTKPELKEKAVKALQKAKETLQVLYCIIEITMLEVPRITCLVPFGDSHVASLRKRVHDYL